MPTANSIIQNQIFKKEIPCDDSGNTVIPYKTITKRTELLKLKSIQNGFDSIQIRVWFEYGLLRKSHLLIFEKKKHLWNAKFYDLILDGSYYDPKAEIVKIRNVIPKSGWPSFIEYIYNNNILLLPSKENTSADIVGPDIDDYAVEISTKKHYRFIDYARPIDVYNKSANAKVMEDFLRYLETEFNFKRPGY